MGDKKEYNRRYYQEHKEEFKERSRAWHWQHREYSCARSREYNRSHKAENLENQRRTTLCTRDEKGNRIHITGLNKRPHSGYCEVCKVEAGQLRYHHWDDSNYSKGIWLGHKCHTLAEMIDSGIPIKELVEIYNELKDKIEDAYL